MVDRDQFTAEINQQIYNLVSAQIDAGGVFSFDPRPVTDAIVPLIRADECIQLADHLDKIADLTDGSHAKMIKGLIRSDAFTFRARAASYLRKAEEVDHG